MARWDDDHPALQVPHRRARVEQLRAPGYSVCLRCRRPWKFVERHVTNWDAGRGCFPLCEGCWLALGTPAARLPYYRALLEQWLGGLGDFSAESRVDHARELLAAWPLIEAAVLAEGRPVH